MDSDEPPLTATTMEAFAITLKKAYGTDAGENGLQGRLPSVVRQGLSSLLPFSYYSCHFLVSL